MASSIHSDAQIPSSDITQGCFIAAGGMGKVYKARWHHHDVVVKQLLVDDLSTEAQTEFFHETEIMARLRHPNIVQFYGICTDARPFQMVMEYMPRGSLYSFLSSKHIFSWQERYRIALDTAAGVAYLHGKKILHRDLKSLNILLDEDFRAKLTDFGLAAVKKETSTQSIQTVGGTLLWMAPELFKRGGTCTVASDVYGLGMVFWEIISGEIPWNCAPSPQIVPTWVMQGEREEIPDGTPKEFEQLIQACWAQEPNQRPTAADVVLSLKALSETDAACGAAFATIPHYETGLASQAQAITLMSGPVYDSGLKTQIGNGESDYKAGLELVLKGQEQAAIPYFEKAAAAEYPAAYLRLIFFSGLYLNDSQGSKHWFKRAAENFDYFKGEAAKGEADAQCNLGRCYDNGIGIKKDLAEAVRWYRLAAIQGFVPAQMSLAFCYEDGKGVKEDPAEAVHWWRAAAEQGNPLAQHNLGVCYQMGKGVRKDWEEAVRWYRLATDQGNVAAQVKMGLCYYDGKGVPKEPAEAVRWFRKAADQGDANAQNNLGICFKNGEGVAKNASEAVRWYRPAAEQGDAAAQFNLGLCYQTGKGVPKDPVAAAHWFGLAAEQGDADAQSYLSKSRSSSSASKKGFFRKIFR